MPPETPTEARSLPDPGVEHAGAPPDTEGIQGSEDAGGVPEALRRPLLVGLLTSVLAVAFENIAVATAMPRAGQDLGRIGLYAWAFTLFVLGMVLSTVVAGRACDRRGPLGPFLCGQLLFLAGLVVSGQASSMLMLVLGRFVQGLGGGAVNLSLMVVVALGFDERRRATVMSAFSFCWVLPAFVGPFVAGWITDTWSWHWVFRAVIPFVLAALALVLPALRLLPTPPDAGTGTPVPLWAAAVAAVGTAGVQYAGQRADLLGLAVAVASAVALAIGVPRLMPPGFWRAGRGLPAVVWTRAAMAGAFFSAESFLPLMLVEQRHLTLTRAGLALTAGSFGWTTGSWLQSRPWLPWGRHAVIVAGTLSQVLGIATAAAFAFHPAMPAGVVWAGWAVAGFGMGLGIASTNLATMTLSDAEALGRNTSSLQVGEGLGNALMGGIAGSVFHLLHARASLPVTFGAVFAVPAVVALFGVLTARRIGVIAAPGDARA